MTTANTGSKFYALADKVEIETSANTPGAAREEFVLEGYDRELETYWVSVSVREVLADGQEIDHGWGLVEVPARAPRCQRGMSHAWDDEKVIGHGGGVQVSTQCAHCYCRRIHDTWMTDRATGRQGLEGVVYIPSDD